MAIVQPTIIHAANEFKKHTLAVSAKREDGSTPGARVTWNTTLPPECVADITVKFRTKSGGSILKAYRTTNTSQTEVIQTGLQCATTYIIRVAVTAVDIPSVANNLLESTEVQVLVGGKVTACVTSSCTIQGIYRMCSCPVQVNAVQEMQHLCLPVMQSVGKQIWFLPEFP